MSKNQGNIMDQILINKMELAKEEHGNQDYTGMQKAKG